MLFFFYIHVTGCDSCSLQEELSWIIAKQKKTFHLDNIFHPISFFLKQYHDLNSLSHVTLLYACKCLEIAAFKMQLY